MNEPIFSNKAIAKMSELRLSEEKVLYVFNKGSVENWKDNRGYFSVKKFTGYEIGVSYFKNENGKYIITSVWKRNRM